MNWLTLRDEFPVTRQWAFLDHAAVAPTTERARQTLVEWANDVAENGVANEAHWIERVEETRQRFGQLLNADPLDVAFVKNTSEGIGFVAEGFPWKAGDNVVVPAEDLGDLRHQACAVREVGRRNVALVGGDEGAELGTFAEAPAKQLGLGQLEVRTALIGDDALHQAEQLGHVLPHHGPNLHINRNLFSSHDSPVPNSHVASLSAAKDC